MRQVATVCVHSRPPWVRVADFISSGAAPFATVHDYEFNLERLDGFATYFGAAIEQARRGIDEGYRQPRVLIEHLLRQVDAMVAMPIEKSPFWSAINRMPTHFSQADRSRLMAAYRASITGNIYPGYRAWQRFLRENYLPVATAEPGRWALKDGDRLYAQKPVARMDIRNLHHQVIETGCLPMDVLEAKIDAWIANREA